VKRSSILLVALGVALCAAGCSQAVQLPVVQTEATASDAATAGDTVDIDGGLRVKLVSVDETVPPDTTESSPTPGPHWIQFEVINSGESSATLPSRAISPEVTDTAGQSLDVGGSSVRLVDGGGGWGPASSKLGEPYLNPGGSMIAWFEVPTLADAARPLVIEYAPTRGTVARYQIP
jgi:hypothetical protein